MGSTSDTILIVDDTPENLKILGRILGDHGYRIAVATNGKTALDRCRSVRPNLVLLDVMMPGIDGFETCRLMKAEPDTADIPVIFLTALDNATSIVEGFEAGGVDYVLKPFIKQVLLARVQTHLALAESREDLQRKHDGLKTLNSELRQTQAQIVHSAKLVALGQFAGGMAHEINNPLGILKMAVSSLAGNVEGLLELVDVQQSVLSTVTNCEHEQERKIQAKMEEIKFDYLRNVSKGLGDTCEGAVDRIAQIIKDLMHFSEGNGDSYSWADLNEELDYSVNLIRQYLESKAVVRRVQSEIPNVRCQAQSLRHVFINLLMNATQAIKSNGRIDIASGVQGDNVWISIRDNGCGISAEHIDLIFDPFYTTRDVGEGMGLGLSVSFGVVQKHQGTIELETKQGEGSCFTIYLPQNGPIADSNDKE